MPNTLHGGAAWRAIACTDDAASYHSLYICRAALTAERVRRRDTTKTPACFGALVRADGGTRTPDPIITSDVLYQLSYVGAVGLDGSDRSGA